MSDTAVHQTLGSKEEFENAVAQKDKLVLIYAVRLAIEA